jgi:hypothetical protein
VGRRPCQQGRGRTAGLVVAGAKEKEARRRGYGLGTEGHSSYPPPRTFPSQKSPFFFPPLRYVMLINLWCGSSLGYLV